MAENSTIEWCDATFNPWIGCTKVGPGCDHCYAEREFDHRRRRAKWGAGQERSRTSAHNWSQPLRWNRQHAQFFAVHGRRRRVFCASLADVFDNEVPDAWRMDLFSLIAQTPNLDWLLLTKRIGNVSKMATQDSLIFSMLCKHVWLGATIVNQEEADRDIPKLLAVPAVVRWLSMEPLLGPVSLDCFPVYSENENPLLHWVVVGGESGPSARPMHPAWARSLRDQCAEAGVPFLFKQWGEFAPGENGHCVPLKKWREIPDGTTEARRVRLFGDEAAEGHQLMAKVGKKTAGRLLDGIEHNSYPEAS